MKEPEMNEEKVSELFGTKYIKIYNMEISEGVNYYQASRHKKEDLTGSDFLHPGNLSRLFYGCKVKCQFVTGIQCHLFRF